MLIAIEQYVIITALVITLIFGVISIYKRSEFPLTKLKEITFGLSIFWGFLALMIYPKIPTYVILILIAFYIIGRSGYSAKEKSYKKKKKKGAKYKGGRAAYQKYSPLNEKTNYNFGCISISGIIGIGVIMFLVFREYLNFRIKSNTNTTALDIVIVLFSFCVILCLTAWGLSIIIKSILSKKEYGLTAFSLPLEKNIRKTNPDKIRKLISNGNYEGAIKELENLSSLSRDEQLEKTILLLKANWSNIEREYMNGQISLEDFRVEKAKFSERILNIIR